MTAIGVATVRRFAAAHADAAEELMRWIKVARHSLWRDLNDVRQQFPDADQYKSLLIFSVRHNHYHLIVKVDYRAKLLMIKEFLPHKDDTREG